MDPVCWSTSYKTNTLFLVRHLVAYSIGVRWGRTLWNALAITANLKVIDIEESLLVHPALAEALAEAAV